MRHPAMLGAKAEQCFGDRNDPLRCEYADHLAVDAGRIGQRSQQVENGARAELHPRRPDMLHRRVVSGCEHEADACLGDAAADLLGRQVDLDAECHQHVGRARRRGQRAVAMLGDRHAGGGDDEGRGGRNVDAVRIVAAGTDDVDGAGRRHDAQHLVAHGGDGAGNLVDRLAAHAQRHQEAADLPRRRVARHDDVEGVARFLEGKRGARRHLGDMGFQGGHWTLACSIAVWSM